MLDILRLSHQSLELSESSHVFASTVTALLKLSGTRTFERYLLPLPPSPASLLSPPLPTHTPPPPLPTGVSVQKVAHQWRPRFFRDGCWTRHSCGSAPQRSPRACVAPARSYDGAAGSKVEAHNDLRGLEKRACREEAGFETHSGLRAPTLLPSAERHLCLRWPARSGATASCGAAHGTLLSW